MKWLSIKKYTPTNFDTIFLRALCREVTHFAIPGAIEVDEKTSD